MSPSPGTHSFLAKMIQPPRNLGTSVQRQLRLYNRQSQHPQRQPGQHLGIGILIRQLSCRDAVGFLFTSEVVDGGNRPYERMEPADGLHPAPGHAPGQVVPAQMRHFMTQERGYFARRKMLRQHSRQDDRRFQQAANKRRSDRV